MDTIQIPSGPSKFVVGEAVPTGRELNDWLLVWAKGLGTPPYVYRDTVLGVVSPMFQDSPNSTAYNVNIPGHTYLKEHDGAYLIANGTEVRRLAAEKADELLKQKQNPAPEYGGPAPRPYLSCQQTEAWEAASPISWPPRDFQARLKGEVDFKGGS
jgi:hypothetical protein